MGRIVSGIALAIMMLSLAACKDKNEEIIVGRWAPMEWEVTNNEGFVETEFISEGLARIYVEEATSVDIVCTNYKGFWFAGGNYYPDEPESILVFDKGWVNLTIEGNVLHCDFSNFYNDDTKEILVGITAGDIFFDFEFIRLPMLDGDWDPMEWKTLSTDGDIVMSIVSEGMTQVNVNSAGSIVIECTNYPGFWFDYGNYYPDKPESIYSYTEQWCELTIEENILHCNFLEPEEGSDKQISVELTAGDVFNNFRFVRN